MDITAVQIITAVVALFASFGIGAIAAAVITARATSSREKSSWMRSEQTKAYNTFFETVWAAVDAVIGGDVQKALDHPTFDGLAEARDALGQHNARLLRAVNEILVVGQELTRSHCMWFVGNYGRAAELATPLPGTAHNASHHQRLWIIGLLADQQVNLAAAMRADLDIAEKDAIKAIRAQPIMNIPADIPIATAVPGSGRAALLEWMVRRADGSFSDMSIGYETPDPLPRPLDPTDPTELRRPVVALALKRPTDAWRFAVMPGLPLEVLHQLEVDAARLICGNAGGWSCQLGGHSWVAYPTPADRTYLWFRDAVLPLIIAADLRRIAQEPESL